MFRCRAPQADGWVEICSISSRKRTVGDAGPYSQDLFWYTKGRGKVHTVARRANEACPYDVRGVAVWDRAGEERKVKVKGEKKRKPFR